MKVAGVKVAVVKVAVQEIPGGVLLPVHAQPGARRDGVTGTHAGRLKVAVTQAPEKGKANKALMDVLARALGVKRSQIELVSGETSGIKKFFIAQVDRETIEERIEALTSLTQKKG